jgi:zinc/manganese transport system substrate-binding protein
MKRFPIVLLVCACLIQSACVVQTSTPAGDERTILTTTSIIADIVQQVGGEYVAIKSLIPPGVDPHGYEPQPQDLVAASTARIIFSHGFGLEGFFDVLVENAGASDKVIIVTNGITPLLTENHAGDSGISVDPHTWMDPNNIQIWLENITLALIAEFPDHAMEFEENARSYSQQLLELDDWIINEVEKIPVSERLIVADHDVLGYFTLRYGFTMVGTITGSVSTEAAPSARELSVLEDVIIGQGIRTIFVSEGSSMGIARQIAEDTGISITWIYHASLSEPDGPVPTYLDLMRYNVSAIVNSLR